MIQQYPGVLPPVLLDVRYKNHKGLLEDQVVAINIKFDKTLDQQTLSSYREPARKLFGVATLLTGEKMKTKMIYTRV